MTTGAEYRADGITARAEYAFGVPASFNEGPSAIAGPVFDIRDFGAIEGASVDNTAMINAAILAANEAGGGTVYIPPGTWGLATPAGGYGCVVLLDNVFVQGAGMGLSSLRLVDGSSDDVTGIVRTPWGQGTSNCGIADLTIDGNKANTTGVVDGFFTGPQPGLTTRDSDVYVMRVEIENVSRYGFDPHEQTERLTIRDSVAHHNGVDGFVLDFNLDAELIGNVSYANGRHGFNFVTTAEDILVTGNVAHDNGGAGFVIQRGSEDIDAAHAITLQGGASYDNGREGVLVQMSRDVVISGMEINGNGREGIRLAGSSNVTVEDNVIEGNSQSRHDGFSEVAILAYNDTVYGRVYEANDNLVAGNTIAADEAIAARYAIEERTGSTAGNILSDNDISGTVRGPIALGGNGSYDLKLGTDGNDSLVGSATQDRLVGGLGNDTMSGQDGADLIEGGAGADQLTGGKGNDALHGGDGADLLNGNSGDDALYGGAGADSLIGDAGNDTLRGGDGNDTVNGGTGEDVIFGDAGDDVLIGGSGIDTLDMSGAAQSVFVDLAARTSTGMGKDQVSGFESVTGGAFADILTGDRNANTLSGGNGNDVLRGLGGADILTGGAGADTFLWASARDVIDSGVYLGLDTVSDFEVGTDVLALAGLVGSQKWTALSDIVRATDGTDGTVISVRIAGTFQNVVEFEGVHGLDVELLASEGLLLV